MVTKKTFPIYQFSVQFMHKGKLKKAVYEENMYSKEFTEEEAMDKMAFLMYYFEDAYPTISKNFTQMDFDVVRWEEWYPEHRCHFTFQLFDDEKSAFDSFRAYLKEKIAECTKSGTQKDDLEEAKNEDWWRQCPCDRCIREGKTRLLHSPSYLEAYATYQRSKTGKNEQDN